MTAKRLLMIDDEEAFCDFVCEVARGMGYQTASTSCADVFKDTFQTFDPHVVVVDVVMPDMDGIELVQWLSSQGCAARVLVVTGYNPDYAAAAAKLARLAGLSAEQASKPLRAEDLRQYLR